jgi:hypothetical protein
VAASAAAEPRSPAQALASSPRAAAAAAAAGSVAGAGRHSPKLTGSFVGEAAGSPTALSRPPARGSPVAAATDRVAPIAVAMEAAAQDENGVRVGAIVKNGGGTDGGVEIPIIVYTAQQTA